MEDTSVTLDEIELAELELKIKQVVSEMCNPELDEYVTECLDQVLADPGNPVLATKASVVAKIRNRRGYPETHR